MVSYLLGSLPSGYLAGKWILGIDLREIGSGSTGATNVLRHVGKTPALFVFFIDVTKGIGAILIAKSFLLDESLQIAAGLASLSGHIWPVWLKGKGGKAVATGLGVFLGISWQVGLGSLGIFLLILSIWRIVSLASISAAISLPVLMLINSKETFSIPYIVISFIAMILVLWRHRSNLIRLIKGQEPRIGKSN
ncbi:Acyl-phosphate:glycerol-3-phosphate O-acyltransferase PlsY [Prochlorococcus sp. SS52]|nr:Acyl-phosphate:glycerol-3-phosphate O-acyltransferase PlsY [Prochlorococcus marinus str. LG]KGG37400.1 Acyl-phosphate:glycerol-3-phosphate O-acyltransferase PlsY [Prochlorococcus sp. SS52]